jgi:hypothetical protein
VHAGADPPFVLPQTRTAPNAPPPPGPQVMLTLGMLSAVLVDAALGARGAAAAWRWMVGAPAAPGAVMAAAVALLPESPRCA